MDTHRNPQTSARPLPAWPEDQPQHPAPPHTASPAPRLPSDRLLHVITWWIIGLLAGCSFWLILYLLSLIF